MIPVAPFYPRTIASRQKDEWSANVLEGVPELHFMALYNVLRDRQMLRLQSKTLYDEYGNLLYKFKAKSEFGARSAHP